MNRLHHWVVSESKKSDFSHSQEVTSVTSSRDFRLLTPRLVWAKFGCVVIEDSACRSSN